MRRLLLLAAALLTLAGSATAETYLYVADHETGKVIKIKEDGTLVWDAPNGNGHDVQVLPNRNVLINHGNVVEEVAPDGKVVWSVGKPTVLEVGSLRMHVIRRGDTFLLRVKDREHPARAAFKGAIAW